LPDQSIKKPGLQIKSNPGNMNFIESEKRSGIFPDRFK
jgi:hypothetical protein